MDLRQGQPLTSNLHPGVTLTLTPWTTSDMHPRPLSIHAQFLPSDFQLAPNWRLSTASSMRTFEVPRLHKDFRLRCASSGGLHGCVLPRTTSNGAPLKAALAASRQLATRKRSERKKEQQQRVAGA